MDRDKYIQEAERQLGDSEVYVKLRKDPTKEMIKKVNKRVRKLRNDGYMSRHVNIFLWMKTREQVAFIFYLRSTKGDAQDARLSLVAIHPQKKSLRSWIVVETPSAQHSIIRERY